MTDSLSRYRPARLKKDAERSGNVAVKSFNRGRFVIQKHDAAHLRYDQRTEMDGVFESWARTMGPSADSQDKRLAVEVEDHPLDYGDFEGVIPNAQCGGGTML